MVLHCKVQEYLIGQGKGRNNNTVNNAWYSSKKDWNFVGRGLSVGKVHVLWPSITQGLGDDTLILTDFIFGFLPIASLKFSVLFVQICFRYSMSHLNQNNSVKRLSFKFFYLLQWGVSFTENMMLVHTDFSLICFLYTTGSRQSNAQVKHLISSLTAK